MPEASLNIIHLISISAILNGAIYSVILFFKKENTLANRFLSLLIFSLSFTLLQPIIIQIEFLKESSWFKFLPFWLILWTGPAFYFYCKSLTNPKLIFKRKDLWHFSFILLSYLPLTVSFLTNDTKVNDIVHSVIGNIGTLAILIVLAYSYMSYQVINKYQKSILNNLSSIDDIRLNWIKQIIVLLVISFTLIFILVLFHYYFITNTSFSIYIEFIPLILSFIIYWLSINGFRQTQVKRITDEKIMISKFNDEHYFEVVERLILVIQGEKLYENPNLSLNLLSDHLSITEKEISVALNQYLKKNFYTFINEFRVKDVKEKIQNLENKDIKILSLAYDAGFNSKSSFNRIFKEYTGNPPSFYRPN